MKDTCPHCQVDGDFYGVPEFVPTRVRCGNCLRVYVYMPSVWERLDREPYEGRANEVYLRPRWRTQRSRFKLVATFDESTSTWSAAPSNSRGIAQTSRDEARAFLARFPVKQLIWMLRSSDYHGPRWEELRAVLAQKPHVEFDARKRSAQRRVIAQRNHGMNKSKDR